MISLFHTTGTIGPYGDMSLPQHWQQCHCSVVRRLTPLPHRTGCVMSKAGEKTRRVIRERGAGGGVCDTPLPVFFTRDAHTLNCILRSVLWSGHLSVSLAVSQSLADFLL